jgi:dephospho-CoA kinase
VCHHSRLSGATLCSRRISKGSPNYHKLVKEFGSAILRPDTGDIDRAALGALVFSDKASSERLNEIAWPAVLEAVRAIVAASRSDGKQHRLVFVEAAMLLEAGWHALDPPLFDEVWSVWAPRELRLRRLCIGRKLERAAALARIEAQSPEEAVLGITNVCLSNVGQLSAFVENGLALAADRAERGKAALWPRKATGMLMRVVGVSPCRDIMCRILERGGKTAELSEAAVREAVGKSSREQVLEVSEDNDEVGPIDRAVMRKQKRWHRATYVFVNKVGGESHGGRLGDGAALQERFLVQRRTHWKDYCPGFMDTNTGGVVSAGEGGVEDDSALRELGEEVGLGSRAPPQRDAVSKLLDSACRVVDESPGALQFVCARPLVSDRARCWGYLFDWRWNDSAQWQEVCKASDLLSEGEASRTWLAQVGPVLALQPEEVTEAYWMTASEIRAAAAASPPGLVDEWTPDGVEALELFLKHRELPEPFPSKQTGTGRGAVVTLAIGAAVCGLVAHQLWWSDEAPSRRAAVREWVQGVVSAICWWK